MKSKRSTGFEPADFQLTGKVSLLIGIGIFVVLATDYLIDLNLPTWQMLFFGLGFSLVGLYLLFIVPKNT